jgi:hypothetical protein
LNYQRTQKILTVILFFAAMILFIVVYIGNLKIVETFAGGRDFFIQWTNARTFLVNGFAPYQEEAKFIVKQDATISGYDFDFSQPVDMQPLFGLIIYFPFLLIKSFSYAFAAWLMLNEISLIATFGFLYRLVGWRGSKILFIITAITILFWKTTLDILLSGSDALLFLFVATAFLHTLRYHMHEMAGVLLAILTIKIYLLWLPIVFILYYCIRKRFHNTLFWLAATLLLVGSSLLLLDPAWIQQYLIAILAKILTTSHNIFSASSFGSLFNQTYFGHFSIAIESVFLIFGVRLGNIFTLIMFIVLGIECASAAKRDDKGVIWLFSFTVLISTWIGINSKSELFAFYIIPVFLFLSLIYDRWNEKGFFVYWSTPGFLLLCNWGVFYNAAQSNLLVFGLYPFLFLVMLYWVRWWALSRNFLVYEQRNR